MAVESTAVRVRRAVARVRRALGRNPEAVGVGSVFLALFAVNAWATLVGSVGYRRFDHFLGVDRIAAFLFPIFLANVVGTALGAWGYARLRNVGIPLAAPARDGLRVAGAVASTPVVLVAVAGLVATALPDASVSAMAQIRYSPDVQFGFLVYTSFAPALFAGVGSAFLLFGVAHERLRRVTRPRHALVLTPVVAGFFRGVGAQSFDATRFDPSSLPRLAAVVAVSVAFGACVGLLYRGTVRDSLADVLRFRYVPVFVVGLLGFVGVALELAEFPTGTVDVLWLGVVAAGAYGYERTRSIWVPAAALAVFAAALDVAAYLETIWGLAPTV